MSSLSIIIPHLASDEQLETTLISVLQNRPIDSEVIVVHRGPYNDPYDLKDEIQLVEVSRECDLAQCINSAIDVSLGSVVHLLSTGTQVHEAWVDAAMTHFKNPRVGMVTPLIIDADCPGHILAAGIGLSLDGSRRLCAAGTEAVSVDKLKADSPGPTLSAAFYRRSALDLCGRFESKVGDGLLDLDLALSMRAVGCEERFEPRIRVVGQALTVSDASSYLAGRSAERLIWRHAPTIGWTKVLAIHPALAFAEFAGGCAKLSSWKKLMGRITGFLEIGQHRAHQRRLRDAINAHIRMITSEEDLKLQDETPEMAVRSTSDRKVA